MKKKNEIISTTKLSNSSTVKGNHAASRFEKKIRFFENIIQKTILSAQKYKSLDIMGANELNICIQTLETLFEQITKIKLNLMSKTKVDENNIITSLQEINDELAGLFRSFGTENMDDLISICLGNDFINNDNTTENVRERYDLIVKYIHPINYKTISWKNNSHPGSNPEKKILHRNRIIEDFMIIESAENLDCFDLARTSKSFQTKVYGIKIALHNPDKKKTMIICGIVDDVYIDCLNHKYIDQRVESLYKNHPKDPEFLSDAFKRYISSLTIKEYLIYTNEELYNRYIGYLNQINLIKQRPISQIVKEFITNELYGQRSTLIQLLLKANEPEYQYLAYLLYDLLSNDMNGNIDTQEQTLLFDSLPWNIKKYFREAMKQTIQYTNDLSNFDNNKIPLEQQICLMKANDNVKEKAMLKLKEVKSKSEDSGSKARQYLDGLLRIPFGIYKEEHILTVMNSTKTIFVDLLDKLKDTKVSSTIIPEKEVYTNIEINKYLPLLKTQYIEELNKSLIQSIEYFLDNSKRSKLINIVCYINGLIKQYKLSCTKLCHSGKKCEYMKTEINDFIKKNTSNINLLLEINTYCNPEVNSNCSNIVEYLDDNVNTINTKMSVINDYMDNVTSTLDKSVYGHKKAKRNIERIIGQWINGEKSGYCFGFEGPPGVGKTSLAKTGIANCLLDEDGKSRPFAFIAIGGSSNGSTLEGHNYTYVGSTWGKIVDVLMDNKCLNPIFFIDELDKVSRTEHGREIIGILTHLIDPTQNDSFQDKYFNGIDIDLSKALFIFSYNDASTLDSILLDRIHRVKFDCLSLDDKLIIVKNYLLPEIYKKMGLTENIISFSDDVIIYIIEQYTCEPGVRKLKEILFEIIGEINLNILKMQNQKYDIPIVITKENVKHNYLKERHQVRPKKIHEAPRAGTINGLWANALGQGGIIPIEANYYPCGTFLDFKLTGMQGDVMKESMNVARTLSWSLLNKGEMKKMYKSMNETKHQGVHIHCPEGATPKDGPSAGTAITVVLYSLFTNKKIKNKIAITGEMCLQGKVTAIGGLDLKILGGIRAGVTEFIFPKENDKDFNDFWEKYKDKEIVQNITFHQVSAIEEVLDLVFE
jgi:endopeptidase La